MFMFVNNPKLALHNIKPFRVLANEMLERGSRFGIFCHIEENLALANSTTSDALQDFEFPSYIADFKDTPTFSLGDVYCA